MNSIKPVAPEAFWVNGYNQSYNVIFTASPQQPNNCQYDHPIITQEVQISNPRIKDNTIDQIITITPPNKNSIQKAKDFWKSKTLQMLGLSVGMLFFHHPVFYLTSFRQLWSEYSNWEQEPYKKVAQLRLKAKVHGFSYILAHQDNQFPYEQILTRPERAHLYLEYFKTTNQEFEKKLPTSLKAKKYLVKDILQKSPLHKKAIELVDFQGTNQAILYLHAAKFIKWYYKYYHVQNDEIKGYALIDIINSNADYLTPYRLDGDNTIWNQSMNAAADADTVDLKEQALHAIFCRIKVVHDKAFAALLQRRS